ncbi:MAG: ABC transporter substrate-binding protein [Rudaea sp.]
MNAKRARLISGLALIGLLALFLVACQAATPAPAPTQAPAPATSAPQPAAPTSAPQPAAPTSVPATTAPTQAPAAATKPTIVIAYDGDIDHIEPMEFRTIAAYDATANLYEPLVEQVLQANDKGEMIGGDKFQGAGAESYQVSSDGKVFTFKLRQNAKFADGTPIKASDYLYTFKRAMEGPGYITLLTNFMALNKVDQIKAKDDYTLEITTNQSSALAEVVLSFQVLGAMSEATAKAKATADDPWAEKYFKTASNSSGPYIITSWKPGVEYVFEPNPNYWRGPDFFKNSKVIFRVVPDAATREQLLKTGDVDIALGVPYSDVAKLEQDPNLTIHKIPTTRVYHAAMNTTMKPFDKVEVRRAVSMAVPYQAIIDKVIYGYGVNPHSPIAPGMATHTDDYWYYDKPDLAAAKKLLADAGYPNGFDVELTVPQEDQARVDSATWIQSGLADIGVKVKVNALPNAQYNDLLNNNKLAFSIFEWYSWGNDPAFQFTWNFKCKQGTNYSKFCDPKLDDLIQQLITTRDPAQREAISKQGQKLVNDAAPWIYLYAPQWIVATRSNVQGISLFNDLTLRYAYIGKK